jgi:undecaprenyl-diphosphatase
VAIGSGLASSLRRRRIDQPYQRLAWLIVVGTVPVGLAGLALDHVFRTTLGRPVPAATFLLVNGAVLGVGERLRRRTDRAEARLGARAHSLAASRADLRAASRRSPAPALAGAWHRGVATAGAMESPSGVAPGRADTADPRATRAVAASAVAPSSPDESADLRLAEIGFGRATLIGAAQILALLPGISRSGAAMTAGLLRGLSHQDAARMSFLLATPVILAAGVFKAPELVGPLSAGIHYSHWVYLLG